MVVNKKGGNKAKKQKKTSGNEIDRPLVFKNELDAQEYAQVTKAYGNGRFETNCIDGKIRLGHARGNLKKKKMFVKVGDLVLVSLRDFEDGKCDILYIYNQKEVKLLKNRGEIPNTIKEDLMQENEKEQDIGIDFKDEDDIDEEEELERKKQEDFKKDFDDNFASI